MIVVFFGLRWIESNPETGFGILRYNLEAVAQVRTTLAVSTSLNGGKIRLCTVRVSGTLKTLREFLREKARS